MAPSHTLAYPPAIQQIPRHGTLTLYGFGIKVRVQSSHLEIEDGVGMERRTFRLPRVGHGLRRLVCISDDGYVSLSALTWLSDVGSSFILLDRRGRVRLVTGPTASSDSKLRRAQVLAVSNGVGLEICRTLVHAKLEGQERLVRERLNDPVTADAVEKFRDRLATAENIETIRILEAHAAVSYFGALRNIEVLWPKSDLRKIPERWRLVGARQSPLSGGPRLAVTPVHAMINYCAALLESESRLAVSALGLLPDLGLGLHTDMPHRDSLVFDVCEPVRPQLENWLLAWVMRVPLRRGDFFETGTGNVRLTSHLCSKLSEIAPTLGKLVSPWAEYVVGTLWASTSRSKFDRIPATHLTQQHRREAKRQPSFPRIEMPRPEHGCSACGVRILSGNKLCSKCAKRATRKNFRVGRKIAQQPEYLAKRAETMLTHRRAIQDWEPSAMPAWLTPDIFVKRVVPALAKVPKSEIRKALGVSEPYAADIRAGRRRPHPRHWQALAQIVGVSEGD